MVTEKQRQHRRDRVGLIKSRNAKKQAATRDTYRATNQQRMAARRALKWIGMLEHPAVFRYKISDLF